MNTQIGTEPLITDAIERLIQSAQEGSVTTIMVVTIQRPRGEEGVSAQSTSPVLTGPQPAGAESPLQALERVRREQGPAAYKAREWAGLLPQIPAREIERAMVHGALRGFAKGVGRDHAATVISDEEMQKYLQTCEDVEGGAPAPEWYPHVVKR